jgi:hypothetical protein
VKGFDLREAEQVRGVTGHKPVTMLLHSSILMGASYWSSFTKLCRNNIQCAREKATGIIN